MAGHGEMSRPGSAGARGPRQHLHAVPSRRAGENRARRKDVDRLSGPASAWPTRWPCSSSPTPPAPRVEPSARRVAGRERLQAEERRPDVVPVLSQSARPARTGRARRVYRARCLQCHATLAERHHPEQRDCVACHMPRVDSADIGHTAVTDHRILRERGAAQVRPLGDKLVLFGVRRLTLATWAWQPRKSRCAATRGCARGATAPRRSLPAPRVRSGGAHPTRALEQAGNRLGRAETLYRQSIDIDREPARGRHEPRRHPR